MPKRFTETEKWVDPWFTELKPQHKIMWMWILDACDHAGIYKHSDKLTSYHVGVKIDFNKFFEAADDRLIQVSKDAYFVPKFVKFQYGPLNPNNSAHRGVIRVLKYYALIDDEGAIKGLPRGYLAPKDKDKDKDKHIHLTTTTHKDKVSVIVDDLNSVLYTKYKKNGKTAELIINRLNDGFDVDDFKAAHRNMHKAWGNCEKMARYLRPQTLYRPTNFENYINYKDTDIKEVDEIRKKAGLL